MRRHARLWIVVLALLVTGPAGRAEDVKPTDPAGDAKGTGAEAAPGASAEDASEGERDEKKQQPIEPYRHAADGDLNEDPGDGEAPLPAESGWHASLVLDNDGVGVWTVKSFQVLPHLGCPEVVGLDDRGRCHVLMSYSGRWTPISVLNDGRWLGGLTHGDVDPRVPGPEVYTGSQRGHVYQVRGHDPTLVDGRLVARIEGREIHTLVAGDLDPRTPGPEVLVFTRPGGLYRLRPRGEHGGFGLDKLMDLPGRIRDAVVLPAVGDAAPRIATVSRTGRMELLQITQDGPQWRTVYRAAMGKGRLALRPAPAGAPVVLYSTHDDGRILRHEEGPAGWKTTPIYLGPQGPRGIAAGRFDADPAVETVAIFGYSGRVELLSRREGGWEAELLFQDTDKGHWLCAGEVDGRNATRELFACGYSGRIVLLTRPPGHGREEAAIGR